MNIQKFYTVIESHSGFVIFCTEDPKTANFVSMGILNSTVKVVHLDGHETKYAGGPFKKLNIDQHYQPYHNTMAQHFRYIDFKLTRQGFFENIFDVSKEQAQMKLYAFLRVDFYKRFVQKFEDQLFSLAEYGDDTFDLIRAEIDKSDAKNKYTRLIFDYAEIHDITPTAAYNELKMKVTSRDSTIIRNKALFDKYIIQLMKIKTYDEGEALFKSAITELLRCGAV